MILSNRHIFELSLFGSTDGMAMIKQMDSSASLMIAEMVVWLLARPGAAGGARRSAGPSVKQQGPAGAY